jgi:tRNA threonylcarbamoyladenosine biosynthesis protein TsaB
MAIAGLFRERGWRLRDCEAVAVSIGPGSFTGLRIGVMCAKTLAYATGCPIAGVDTLQAIAENSPADVDEVFVASDAQRGQWYVARYRRERGVFVRVGELEIVDAATWCRDRAAADVVSGPAVSTETALLEDRCRVLGEEFREPRAETVARLGLSKLRQGAGDDPWRLVPIYVRRSAAEERKGG